MDGEPLSRPHGSPARVVIPEMYGYKGVKWLTRIELVAQQPTGYWEGLGYDQNAWVGRSNGYCRLSARRLRALRPHRARRALGARDGVLRPARHRGSASTCRASPSGRPAAAAEVDPHLHGGRVGGRARRWSSSLGDRRALRRTAREIDTFDADDRAWLRGGARRRAG